MCIAAIVGACTAKPAEEAWVKVEGNKFISHGKTSGKWSPTLIEDWNFTPTTQGRFFKEYLGRFSAEK